MLSTRRGFVNQFEHWFSSWGSGPQVDPTEFEMGLELSLLGLERAPNKIRGF